MVLGVVLHGSGGVGIKAGCSPETAQVSAQTAWPIVIACVFARRLTKRVLGEYNCEGKGACGCGHAGWVEHKGDEDDADESEGCWGAMSVTAHTTPCTILMPCGPWLAAAGPGGGARHARARPRVPTAVGLCRARGLCKNKWTRQPPACAQRHTGFS